MPLNEAEQSLLIQVGKYKGGSPGPNSIKKIYSINLHYAGYEYSDWLKNVEQPIRVLKKLA